MKKYGRELKSRFRQLDWTSCKLVDPGKPVRHVFGDRSECPEGVFAGYTGRYFSLNSMDESSAFMLLSSLAAAQPAPEDGAFHRRRGSKNCHRFDLNCATLICGI